VEKVEHKGQVGGGGGTKALANKEKHDPMHSAHWERLQINTVTGKENWWVYVVSKDSPHETKIPLRRRHPPNCVTCGEKVLVEDETFSRYGVEWQPVCVRCYSNGVGVPLVDTETHKPTLTGTPKCYWCGEVEGVKGQTCDECQNYVSRAQSDFGMDRKEALANLYYFMTGLREQRK